MYSHSITVYAHEDITRKLRANGFDSEIVEVRGDDYIHSVRIPNGAIDVWTLKYELSSELGFRC